MNKSVQIHLNNLKNNQCKQEHESHSKPWASSGAYHRVTFRLIIFWTFIKKKFILLFYILNISS